MLEIQTKHGDRAALRSALNHLPSNMLIEMDYESVLFVQLGDCGWICALILPKDLKLCKIIDYCL